MGRYWLDVQPELILDCFLCASDLEEDVVSPEVRHLIILQHDQQTDPLGYSIEGRRLSNVRG